MIDSDSDILCQREMNERNFVAHGMKLEGILDGILMEFHMFISEDKNQIQKLVYIPWYLSSSFYGRSIGTLDLEL